METVKNLFLKVKVIQREVKNGKEKGKKFLSYKVKNTKSGYYEELKFNRDTTKQPKEEGLFILECQVKNINRIGTDLRDYPLTWIRDVESIVPYETVQGDEKETEELPF